MSGRDYDQVLRRALHAAVESVEPSSDGLDRIRARLGKQPQLSFAAAAGWYSETTLRVVGWAEPMLAAIADTFRKTIDRFRPPASRPGHAKPRFGWLRPVAAMATFIFVVAAGAAAAMTIPQAISSSSSSMKQTNQVGQQGNGGSGQHGASHGHGSPLPSGSGTQAFTHPSHSSSSPAAKKCHVAGSSPLGSATPTTTPTTPTTTPTTPTPSSDPPPTTITPTPSSDPPPSQTGSSNTSSPRAAQPESSPPQTSPRSATQAPALQPAVGAASSSSSPPPLSSPAPYQGSPCPSSPLVMSASTAPSLGGALAPGTTSGHGPAGRIPPADRAGKNG